MPKVLRISRPILFLVSSVFLITGALVLLVSWIGSTRLIVPNRPAPEERHFDLLTKPSEYGMTLEEIEFRTNDDFILRGILAKRASDPGRALKTREMIQRLKKKGVTSTVRPRGTILLLHGSGGIKENMLSIAKRFVAADFRCLVYDARAHGMSEGNYCTFGKMEVRDLEAILSQTTEFLEQRGEEIGPIGVFGNSLGAAVALQAAQIPEPPQAIVAVSPFTNLPEIVHRSGKRMIHRHLPEWLSRNCLVLGGWRAGFDPFSIVPLENAKTMETPLFIAHGKLDGVIPISHGKRIFTEAASLEKSWYEVETGEHGNILARGGDDLYEEMVLFFLRTLAGIQSPVTASR